MKLDALVHLHVPPVLTEAPSPHTSSPLRRLFLLSFFFFNDTATTEIYTLSLHDALPISLVPQALVAVTDTVPEPLPVVMVADVVVPPAVTDQPVPVTDQVYEATITTGSRSEEHTSELQSHSDLVCRLLLEKKKKEEPPVTLAGAPGGGWSPPTGGADNVESRSETSTQVHRRQAGSAEHRDTNPSKTSWSER